MEQEEATVGDIVLISGAPGGKPNMTLCSPEVTEPLAVFCANFREIIHRVPAGCFNGSAHGVHEVPRKHIAL